MVSLLMLLYNLLFPLLFVIYLPLYLLHLVKRGGFKEGFGERFGMFSRAKTAALATRSRPVWIHAVSVGETVAALSFIRKWTETEPGIEFVLSTTTSTGQRIAREKAPENVTPIYCPLDWYFCVLSTLRRVQPRMFVIFEVEVWPTMIRTISGRGIPTALVNCRMSDKSAAGYARHVWFFRKIFNAFSAICAQSEEDAKRVERVVGKRDRIHICNTMKFDQVPDRAAGEIAGVLDAAFGKSPRLVFTAASTHGGEEAVMAASMRELLAGHPYLRMVLVPRHAERAAQVKEVLRGQELSCIELTRLRETPGAAAGVQVLLVDTTGELMNFLAASDVVFVGKTLAGNTGGHNIIEPAIFGKPIIFGEHMENFRLVAELFKASNSVVEVADERAFTQALGRLLGDASERARLCTASREVVEANRGAILETIEILRGIDR